MTTFLFLALAMSAQGQPTAPKNLAGAEFPCNYERMTPNTITAKFLDTVGDVTFLTGDVQIRSAKILVHADGRPATRENVSWAVT